MIYRGFLGPQQNREKPQAAKAMARNGSRASAFESTATCTRRIEKVFGSVANLERTTGVLALGDYGSIAASVVEAQCVVIERMTYHERDSRDSPNRGADQNHPAATCSSHKIFNPASPSPPIDRRDGRPS